MAPPMPLADVPLDAWMGHLPAEVRKRSFSELALPGAHNAGARAVRCIPSKVLAQHIGTGLANLSFVADIAKQFATAPAVCQTLTIKGLLMAGIRILDFRVGLHEGEIHLCHSVICDTSFQEALMDIVEFLRARPTEVVAVLIKRDWEHPELDTPDNWDMLQACVVSVLDEFLWEGADALALPIASLQERGKRALVLLELPEGVELLCGLPITAANFEKSWRPDTKTVEDMLRVLGEWRRTQRMAPEPGRLKLLEVALPGGPLASAPAGLAAFREFIRGHPLGIGTMLDDPDELTVRAIIAKNWPE